MARVDSLRIRRVGGEYEFFGWSFASGEVGGDQTGKAFSFLPQLKRDRASIVNVASSVAFNPLPNMSLCAASKAFVLNWSEALSYELRHTNRVLTVSLSATRTGFQKASGLPVEDGRGLQSAEYVAARIIKCLGGKKHSVVLGGAGTRALLLVSRFLPRDLNVKLWGILFERMR